MTHSTEILTKTVDFYTRYRPSYPEEVIQLLINKKILLKNSVVADLGAGTGIFTKLLLEQGSIVYAVEPNQAMRIAAESTLMRYPNIHEKNKKMRVTSLFPFDKQLNCEIFMIELLPNCVHLSDAHELGVIEHIMVMEGSMEILLKKKWKMLHAADGLRFNADQQHGYRNLTTKPVRFYNIIHYQLSATL